MTPAALVERLLTLLGRPRPYQGLRGVGQRWERLAERRLKAEGYRIRERNFRARGGEIDFVAEQDGVLCFVEVKGRRGPRFGSPAEAVDEEQQRRLVLAAEQYLAARRAGRVPCRFDVVSIRDGGDGTVLEILPGAFEAGPPR